MNISDTFYVALCMTVLILGVVYWFWTQNQYIQRKLNLLENIVYEMKTTMNSVPEPMMEPQGSVTHETLHPAVYPPAPSSELGEDDDLLHKELHATVEEVEPMEDIPTLPSDDLQPGGVGSSVKEILLPDTSETGSPLESMTLKDLRRLADQKNIQGASSMRKQALLDAIRNAVPPFQDSN